MKTKMTYYKVQTAFDGNDIPMMATKFDRLEDAKQEYTFQKAREDCSFCNLVKITAEVVDGDSCGDIENTFRMI